jgi:CIC family chloride channel protein
MRVNEVMVREVDTLPAAMPIDEAISFFSSEARRHKSYPLIDAEGRVAGMVARADVLRWRAENPHGEESLFDRVSDRSLTVGYADEPVSHLADRMVLADLGRVPIVDRETQRLVARKDLLRIRATAKSTEASRAAYLGWRSSPKAEPVVPEEAPPLAAN